MSGRKDERLGSNQKVIWECRASHFILRQEQEGGRGDGRKEAPSLLRVSGRNLGEASRSAVSLPRPHLLTTLVQGPSVSKSVLTLCDIFLLSPCQSQIPEMKKDPVHEK